MNAKELKQWIINESKVVGIDKIGFTHTGDFAHLKESLKEQKAKGHTTGFEHQNIDERIYPEKIFDHPKTIISIALAYPTKIHKKHKETKKKRGKFARASWGVDYHTVLNKRMNELIKRIQQKVEGEYHFKPMVDTGELIDVAVAERAGLGFIGKNGLLITEEFGSFVYLGEIITNLSLPIDEANTFGGCGDCTRCLTNCPTSCLLGDGRMNATRCLSYQTQAKGVMPLEFRKKMRTMLYGCDICQLVCPYNKGKDFHFHEEMEPNPEDVEPILEELLDLTNKEFKERFGYLAGAWRGKKTIQRNALIALANANSKASLPLLWEIVENDPRVDIQATAIWAIGELTKEFAEVQLETLEGIVEKTQSEEIKQEYLRIRGRMKQ